MLIIIMTFNIADKAINTSPPIKRYRKINNIEFFLRRPIRSWISSRVMDFLPIELSSKISGSSAVSLFFAIATGLFREIVDGLHRATVLVISRDTPLVLSHIKPFWIASRSAIALLLIASLCIATIIVVIWRADISAMRLVSARSSSGFLINLTQHRPFSLLGDQLRASAIMRNNIA